MLRNFKKGDMKNANLILTILLFLSLTNSFSQQKEFDHNKLSVVFGLNQPIFTKGFNFEVNYWTKKYVIDYSHGFGLEFTDNLVSDEAKEQHLSFKVKHSVGIGFGYRFTKNFNLRLEPKIHTWEMYYDDSFLKSEGKIKSYTTYTLGLGAYYRWTPFEKKDNFMKGITISPSIRWWPNIASSLDNNEYHYYNERTQQNEVHEANKIGLNNSPFFANISIGYTLDLTKK